MTDSLIMYTTSWCGYCVRLKHGLARAGVSFTEINIEQDDSAADRVMQVNGGNQTVPTLEFSDGSALTNPTVQQVQEKLAALV
ncbi:MAG: mycoredoxin [Pseudonocardiales bacterium]|jgi:mycoredoxin|nr:mycoredoxin [Pseudonocardiales bacterium]